MESLPRESPQQPIDRLPISVKQEIYQQLGLLCIALRNGEREEKELAKKAGFFSAEVMCISLENWGLSALLPSAEKQPKESGTNQTKKKAREKSTPRAQNLGPAKGLPPAGNAIPLIKERLEALLESVELLGHMDEDLRGKYFVRTHVERAPVFYPRERYSKEEWDKLCELYDLDPDDKGFWDTNALISLPGGVAPSPSEIEATLIGVYALAGGRMDLLLDALHHDKPPLGTETWEGIRVCVEGAKADGDTRDGLKVLAQHLATWVRGSEVRSGRPSAARRSEADHALACRITHHRKHGLTDEEIARRESHRKKEDGTSYSVKDITELGDLGLSWP